MNRKQRRAAGGPGHTAAFVQAFNVALKLHHERQFDKAEAAYRKAMTLNASDAMLYNNLGAVLHDQNRDQEAAECQRKAIKIDPNHALAHNNLGVSLNSMEAHEEAVVAFARAIELNPINPEALNNMGDSYIKLGRFAEGLKAVQRAIAILPNYAEAYSNMGMGYWGLGDLDKAIASLRHAIALQPTMPMPHKNLGIVSLLKGDYAVGWREYDYRWLSEKFGLRKHPKPIWSGSNVGADETLFVWAEQGVGDEILHASMMPDLVARGFKVVWECDERLVPLLQRSCPAVKVVGRRTPPAPETEAPGVAAHIPAGSLGQHFRHNIALFPRDRQGYLAADRARAESLRASFALAPGEKLVGMSWLSKNYAFGSSKSTALADWADILRTPGLRFVDLQYGDTTEERAALKSNLGINLAHVDGLDLHNDLDGIAALITACDLVVTVSNTTAHIAGALGAPVWVMIPAGMGKFWYWGLTGDSTPWYPSATVFRQQTHQDWKDSFSTVAARLAEFVAGR